MVFKFEMNILRHNLDASYHSPYCSDLIADIATRQASSDLRSPRDRFDSITFVFLALLDHRRKFLVDLIYVDSVKLLFVILLDNQKIIRHQM